MCWPPQASAPLTCFVFTFSLDSFYIVLAAVLILEQEVRSSHLLNNSPLLTLLLLMNSFLEYPESHWSPTNGNLMKQMTNYWWLLVKCWKKLRTDLCESGWEQSLAIKYENCRKRAWPGGQPGIFIALLHDTCIFITTTACNKRSFSSRWHHTKRWSCKYSEREHPYSFYLLKQSGLSVTVGCRP